ncbi:sensor histidine kinase [Streptomyces sp. NPDC101152]|uniref:sensor histidine kinase n=1 Tax=Streptomyces sp. NPDC101152 TaxID=3366116 RepID=UPI00382DFE34
MTTFTGEGRGMEDARNREPLAWLPVCIVLVVQLSIAVLGFLNLLAGHPKRIDVAVLGVSFTAVLLIQGVHCAPGAGLFRNRYGRLTLGLQALLTYGPLFVLGLPWSGMSGFLAGSALLLLRPPWSVLAFLASVVVTGGFMGAAGQGLLGIAIGVLSCIVNGLMVYGLTRVSAANAQMRQARDEVARLAVEKERMRVARDLHDLLGFSLSAIALKGALVDRLLDDRKKEARSELREVLEISRRALSDLRCVSHGYRRLSLAAELSAACRVLDAAGIAVQVQADLSEIDREPLSEDQATVLATVLREGVNNILRHSDSENCRISVARTRRNMILTLSNDGVRTQSPFHGMQPTGAGLDNLGARLDAVGGTFEAGAMGDGWFRLTASCP